MKGTAANTEPDTAAPASATPSMLRASTVHLRAGPWHTVLDALCAHFVHVPRSVWIARMTQDRVHDLNGQPLSIAHTYREGLRVQYFREVEREVIIPFQAQVLHCDAHLLVADKPHFLPVMPAGRFVRETLLARLIEQTGNTQLTPLHRLDRGTAGLVLFSTNTQTRGRYHPLFRDALVQKYYEARAHDLARGCTAQTSTTLRYGSRLQPGEPFYRMCEVAGQANSETDIDVLGRGTDVWHYGLRPRTGRKHQLRVHMAALGAPIYNDASYPNVIERAADDFTRPLQLLARRLEFVDPIAGQARRFDSRFALAVR